MKSKKEKKCPHGNTYIKKGVETWVYCNYCQVSEENMKSKQKQFDEEIGEVLLQWNVEPRNVVFEGEDLLVKDLKQLFLKTVEEENKSEQEKRFMDWVNERDDDWWEDGQRISVWDFRVMQEFFLDDLKQNLKEKLGDSEK